MLPGSKLQEQGFLFIKVEQQFLETIWLQASFSFIRLMNFFVVKPDDLISQPGFCNLCAAALRRLAQLSLLLIRRIFCRRILVETPPRGGCSASSTPRERRRRREEQLDFEEALSSALFCRLRLRNELSHGFFVVFLGAQNH